VVDVANAVVDRINLQTLSQSFTAVRKYNPTLKLEDAASLVVSVWPETRLIEFFSRREYGRRIAIAVMVQKNVSAVDEDTTEIDALMLLVDEIIDRLEFEHLNAGAPIPKKALFQSIVNDPVCSRDTLEIERQFVSKLVVTYLLSE